MSSALLELRLELLLLRRRLQLALFALSFQRRELRRELEIGLAQLCMGKGGLCLQGAVVVPPEEEEQADDEDEQAGCGAHAGVARANLKHAAVSQRHLVTACHHGARQGGR